jgi:anaerobic selenocysteine-containing dehydrogenase
MKKIVHAVCPHDCPDACGTLITVEDGRATKIEGDPAHPVTRGFLCAKVSKYLDRVYSPDRVLYPMRRVGPKGPPASPEAGNSAWERITWDQALNDIASRFHQITAEFGSEAILPYSYGGTIGVLNGAGMDRRFFHRLGASQLDRTICSAAGDAGMKSVLGGSLGTEPEQFSQSRYIIAWAANIHGNNVHLWPFVEEARHKGAKLVVIDPYRTRTARCADWYLPIHPGTDAALALGMMHIIIGEGLHDEDYVTRHTLGFDHLREKVKQYTPDRVAQWTGISTDDILKLAREYATVRPAAIRLNYGVQRSENGGMATRAIAMLPCITGSWKEVGGGFQMSISGAFGLNREAIKRTDLMQKSLGREARTINMVELGKVLNSVESQATGFSPPVKALFVYNSNPAAVCPNSNQVIKGLLRPDLFTVVHEQFFTDTTDYADMVLPATTFFEHKELQSSYGHYYLQVSDQAIVPLGECRSNVETFRALAQKMGFEDECFDDSVNDMIDQALDSPNPLLKGVTREKLAANGHVRLNFGDEPSKPYLPFANGNFPTPSGRAELYSEALKAQGLDPVVDFIPPTESRHGKPGAFPLELLARKADNFLNTTFANQPSMQKMEEVGLLEMSQGDAKPRGIADGDSVRVFNQRGDILLKARVDGAVQRGVVSAKLQWAKFTQGSRNINVLTSEKLTDLGNSATFYSVLVEVELFRTEICKVQ